MANGKVKTLRRVKAPTNYEIRQKEIADIYTKLGEEYKNIVSKVQGLRSRADQIVAEQGRLKGAYDELERLKQETDYEKGSEGSEEAKAEA